MLIFEFDPHKENIAELCNWIVFDFPALYQFAEKYSKREKIIQSSSIHLRREYNIISTIHLSFT